MEKMTITGNMRECIDLIEKNKNEVVVIEGARGIGKSTFCKYISSYWGIPSITAWQNRKELSINYLQAQLDITQTGFGFLDMYIQMCGHIKSEPGKPKLVVDRGYLTAAVFQDSFSIGKMRLYKELLKRCNGTILYLRNRRLEEPGIDGNYDYVDSDLKEEDRLFMSYLETYFKSMYHLIELDTNCKDGIMYFM